MGKHRKKIVKKAKSQAEVDSIEEFVSDDGSKIGGTYKGGTDSITSKKTTDTTVVNGRQKDMSYNSPYGAYTAGYARPKHLSELANKKTLDEIARDKMRGVIENLLKAQDSSNSDVITRKPQLDNDVINNREVIPGIEELMSPEFDSPLVAKDTVALITRMLENEVTGEIKGIVLNHLIDGIYIDDVPSHFRDVLKDKL